MCLAVPGRILRLREVEGGVLGVVELGGTEREINLALVPDAATGDYVIVHSGIAVRHLSPAEAAGVTAALDSVAAGSTASENA